MLQYVFNYMCVPFQHQTSRASRGQVASECTHARAHLLAGQVVSLVSGIARIIARKPNLASTTPGGLVTIQASILGALAICTRTAIARSHVRIVHLDQWNFARQAKHH